MKITLIHNPKAGAGQDDKGLIRLMTEAGHEVRDVSIRTDWKKALDRPTELVVAAGGDGTVRRVALEAAARALPFAAIPVGTANNIAKSVGLLGSAEELIGSWSPSPRHAQPFDLGEAEAPWGRARFVEGVGAGLIGDLIRREEDVEAEAKFLGREMDRALQLLCELVREAKPRHWKIRADGADLSGDYFAVEILNIRFVGPNLPFAPAAFPGDGRFDAVLLRKADREALLAYLESRMHLAAGQLPDLQSVQAERFEIEAPKGVCWHVDDKNWPSDEPCDEPATVVVECRPGALTWVAAPGTERVEAEAAAAE